MPNVVEHRKFVFVNAQGNNNKVWEVVLYDNEDVEVRYGRIGKGLQSKVHPMAGRKKLEALIRAKTTESDHYNGGCYREIVTLDTKSSASPKQASKVELKEIAKKQIATCAITQKLIEFFTEVNAHNIYQATGGRITYDVSAGTFSTPIGVVTRDNVDKARSLLDTLTSFVEQRSFARAFVAALEDYLMLIPQDVGRKFDPQTFCGDTVAIQRQSQILDGLEASITAVLSTSKDKKNKPVKQEKEPQLFNVKMSVENDRDILKEITDFYNKGKKHGHVSYGLRMATAYSIDMPSMQSAWDNDGAKMSNIWKLWHGSKASNCLSILKSGFMIPPASASHCCGRAFGDGCYFSRESTKSLNYAMNYWGGRDEGRYFMFYNLVAMGKYFVPTSTFSGGCRRGFDSTFCKPGGVFRNSEMIVYRTSQILPTHLVEFSKK